jgi:hypothetical protein
MDMAPSGRAGTIQFALLAKEEVAKHLRVAAGLSHKKEKTYSLLNFQKEMKWKNSSSN